MGADNSIHSRAKRQLIDNGDGTHLVPTSNPNVFAVIDSTDAEIVGRYSWQAMKSRNNRDWYAGARVTVDDRRCYVWLSHLISGSPCDGLEVDHIDRNPLNNRRSNLRHVTHKQNVANRGEAILTDEQKRRHADRMHHVGKSRVGSIARKAKSDNRAEKLFSLARTVAKGPQFFVRFADAANQSGIKPERGGEWSVKNIRTFSKRHGITPPRRHRSKKKWTQRSFEW